MKVTAEGYATICRPTIFLDRIWQVCPRRVAHRDLRDDTRAAGGDEILHLLHHVGRGKASNRAIDNRINPFSLESCLK